MTGFGKLRGLLMVAVAFVWGSAAAQQPQPGSPTNVVASAQAGYVHVSWDAVDGISTYVIYRYTITPGIFLDETTLTATSPGDVLMRSVSGQTYFNDTSANTGTMYMYAVVSQNEAGDQGSIQAFNNYSCGTPFSSDDTGNHPAVRPLVYMAAHGSNGVGVPTPQPEPATGYTGSSYVIDPGPGNQMAAGWPSLIQTDLRQWDTVASCLDGIWGNYAHVPAGDENTLYTMVNTKNTIAEDDIAQGNALADPTSPSLDPPNLTLNRRGIEIYAGDPAALGVANANSNFDTTLANLQARFSNGSSAATSYAHIYTGFNLNRWVAPSSQTSGMSPGSPGVYTYPNATSVFLNANGNMQECNPATAGSNNVVSMLSYCDDIDSKTEHIDFENAFLNQLIQTRINNGTFILFFSVGGNGYGPGITGYPTTGALTELQTLYQYISMIPCSGKYVPPNNGGMQSTYNFCDQYPNPGMWRANDVVMIINYHGWYPPTPQYTQGATDDNVTGMLNWLISQ